MVFSIVGRSAWVGRGFLSISVEFSLYWGYHSSRNTKFVELGESEIERGLSSFHRRLMMLDA